LCLQRRFPAARYKKGYDVKDAVSDALASGSEPSETGIAPKRQVPAGIAQDGATRAPVDGRHDTGHAARPPETPVSDDAAAVQDGRLDHHKDKKGRKRRRRRRSGQKPGGEDAGAIALTAATHGGTDTPKPDTGGAPRRRKRRRRRKPHATAQGAGIPVAENVSPAERAANDSSAKPPVPSNPAAGRNSRPANARMSDLYAALDLGTNNCRLLVATPTRPGQFRVVDAFSRIVRLGEGLSMTGELNERAMDRAIEALNVCREKIESKHIRRSRLIATEACRSAQNGSHFLDRVRAETGLDLEIVDRQTEARLAVSGCSSLVGRDTDSVVLFDIGGGSSEIALVDVSDRRSRRLADHIVAWTSLQIGVVTLSEKFGGHHVTEQSFGDMTDHATELLMKFEERDRLADRIGTDGFHLLGTSGTVTTLAGIHLDLPRYDRRRVDGLWMSADEVDAMNGRLLSWSFEERVANPCIGADRADLVMAGCAILEAIRRVWPSKRLRVADRGLREGLLTEMMASDGAWRRGVNPWRNRPRRNTT
jgi:exopolyphosphatase/guanosine-5'-triphosphate,3'-diphosphate pyrophosphatase